MSRNVEEMKTRTVFQTLGMSGLVVAEIVCKIIRVGLPIIFA